MNKITTIAAAGALGFLGLACGWTSQASAQVDPGVHVAVGSTAGITDGTREAAVREYYNQFLGRDAGAGAGTTGELLPAVMPAGQKAATDGTRVGNGEGMADLVTEAYGDVLGRDTSGGQNGLIGLLNQEATGPKAGDGSMDRMPAEQTGGDGMAELIVGAGAGGENGLIGLLRPQGMATDQLPAVQKTTKLASLASLGSVGDLFPLSRGDNNTPPGHSTDHVKVFSGAGNSATGGSRVNPDAAKGLTLASQGGNANNTPAGGTNAGTTKGATVVRTPR